MDKKKPTRTTFTAGNTLSALVRGALRFFILLQLAGCSPTQTENDVFWAVNVGGPAYSGVDGSHYLPEESVTGGKVGSIEQVRGTQDAFIYQSYREGDIEVAHPIDKGTYDITLNFAEPDEKGPGDRLFDVFIEGDNVIDNLDVMLFRDGKRKSTRSGLTVTVPNVEIADDELNVHFEASVGQPILSALLVRGKQRRAKTWELVWSDEFDIDGPVDAAKWNFDEWPARVVNDEDQAYTARLKNVRVADGHLVIEAHKEQYGDAQYTSGRIHSRGKGDFLYGRFEVRTRLPVGQGTWAANWMLPSDPLTYATNCESDKDWQGSEECDAWPNSGEIDILEHVGYQAGHIHGTVHNKAYYFANWEQRKGRILLDDVVEKFHVYALEWSPKRIDIFVDDALYFTYVNEGTGWREWPYDHPYHLILNLAIGGAWGRSGGPIDDSLFPQQMLVDYVRVYRQTGR